jgi:hypothetical protein
MVFGYMIVQKLLVLVPEPVAVGFARMLNSVTKPFDVINYYGSCLLAARVFNRRRMGAEFDRVLADLQRKLDREREIDFGRGMHYPTRWDPFFHEYMTL